MVVPAARMPRKLRKQAMGVGRRDHSIGPTFDGIKLDAHSNFDGFVPEQLFWETIHHRLVQSWI